MKKLRPSGGYRDTCSFQTATLIYDSTVWFCEKFVDSRSRLVDQMVQAARSGGQIGALERQFVEGGGYSEQLATARLAHRAEKKKNPTDLADRSDRSDLIPACPQCGGAMALRTAKTGKNAGQQFWGCASYPDCKGLMKI